MVAPGECGTCRQAHDVRSARGATFVLCGRSRTDARYPRYPALPRWRCPGYDPEPPIARVTVPDAPASDLPVPDVPRPPADLQVRVAVRADVPVILSFIEQLAEFEQLRHEVQASEDALATTLFGPRRAAEVIIASLAGRDVGFALFFETYSTFLARPGIHLEDIFVVEDARGHGVGRALLGSLAAVAEQRGSGRLEWAVLTWNDPAIRFYQHVGAFPLDGWQTYRLDREGIQTLAAGATLPSHHD